MRFSFFALTLALAATAGCKRGTPEPAIRGERGNIALVDAEGKAVKLSTYGRRVTMIALWSDTCEPCKLELPYVDKLAESYAGDPDVAILAVNVMDDPKTARESLKKLGVKLPALSDPKGELRQILAPAALQLPLLATIDAAFVIHHEVGYKDPTDFVTEKRARIEAARRGELPKEEPMGVSLAPASMGSMKVSTKGKLEDFRAAKAQIREDLKKQFHLSDADADKMVDSIETQLQADGGTPKIVVPQTTAP